MAEAPSGKKPVEMHGKDYRALRRLSTKADRTLADVGDTCEKVPKESLPALLASGKIEPAVNRRDPDVERRRTPRATLR